MNKALAMILAALAFAAFAVDTNRVTMTRLGSLNPRSGEVVTDVNFSGIAMTGDVARVEGKVDGMTNTFLRLSGGVISGDLVVLSGVPYAVRLGKSPYTNFYGNGIWWGDEIGLASACGIVCESLLGNIHFVSQGNVISLPSSPGVLALQSDIPTTMAWSAITGKPTIPSTASDIGALPISGGTMIGNLVIGYNSLLQINGGGNAKFQFGWGSALDNLIISAYKETSGSYSIRFPTREGLLALTSDIPTSMAWSAITGKPTTVSGYGITDALSADFASLTNNAAFTSAVAAVSPPTDLTHVEAEIETNRTAIATLSARAYIEVVSADEVYYVFTTNQE